MKLRAIRWIHAAIGIHIVAEIAIAGGPPTGACCQTGVCTQTFAANCSAMGGTYQGDFTSCSPNPCGDPFNELGTSFTYQGYLENPAETPVDANCEIRFGLWDAASGGIQKGNSPQTKTDVVVTSGLFTVSDLDFGAMAIDGTPRWLAIEVKCPGDPDFVLLDPRVRLNPTPHALALPGVFTQQNGTSPNIIAGYSGNTVAPGIVGATISGGGAASQSELGQCSNSPGSVCAADADCIGGFCTLNGTCSHNAQVLCQDDAPCLAGYCDLPPSPNSVTADFATVGGGSGNIAGGDVAPRGLERAAGAGKGSTIGGGEDNKAAGRISTVGGGKKNEATGQGSSVGGGETNKAAGNHSTVAGGTLNTASGATWTTVGGGVSNVAGSVCKGGDNDGKPCRVAGDCPGAGAVCPGGIDHATVGGGYKNKASSIRSTIGGGNENKAGGDSSTVAGGAYNVADGAGSTICGGSDNFSSGTRSTLGGGAQNIAGNCCVAGNGSPFRRACTVNGDCKNGTCLIAEYATVSGGAENFAVNHYSTVPGGRHNVAGASYSMAAGYRAKVRTPGEAGNANGDLGSFVWADVTLNRDFKSTGENQFNVRATGGVMFASAVNPLTGAVTAGVTLASGGGAWAQISDRNSKENFAEVNKSELLDRLAQVPITTWNYKSQHSSIRHIGPMGQDFHSAFGVGEEETRITTIDSEGVALAAIQGLYEMLQEKDCEVGELRDQKDREIERLGSEISILKTQISELRMMMEKNGGSR